MNEARKAIGRPKAASEPRILVVEDESDLALLLAYNLEAEGYVVERVERGDEAELRLAENAPDLVILDWMLPGVSGLEICRRLRARETTRTLPVIMVTARGEEAERVRGLLVGADDYVVKPFSVPELMARVSLIAKRFGCDAANATSISLRPSSGCWSICWKSRGACSRAPNCLMGHCHI
jgi:two-component system phosphate regulon response regulator PhoB